MWEIYEHRGVAKRMMTFPLEVRKRYDKWKDIVRISGPEGLKLIKGFHDEALKGKWKDHRSSRLGDQYWLIYKIVPEGAVVLVADITAHDYRRK